MNRDRRRFIATTATLAAAQIVGVAPERRNRSAEAAIGITTLGSLGVAPLFR